MCQACVFVSYTILKLDNLEWEAFFSASLSHTLYASFIMWWVFFFFALPERHTHCQTTVAETCNVLPNHRLLWGNERYSNSVVLYGNKLNWSLKPFYVITKISRHHLEGLEIVSIMNVAPRGTRETSGCESMLREAPSVQTTQFPWTTGSFMPTLHGSDSSGILRCLQDRCADQFSCYWSVIKYEKELSLWL